MEKKEGSIVKHVRIWLKPRSSSVRALRVVWTSTAHQHTPLPRQAFLKLWVLSDEKQHTPVSRWACKRERVPQAPAIGNSFAGVQRTEESLHAKSPRIVWPRSPWFHFNEPCARVMPEKPSDVDRFALTVETDENRATTAI